MNAAPLLRAALDPAVQHADIIRSAAAWWNRAADLLESDDRDVDQARDCAWLGRFGLDGMVDKIAELTHGGPS